MQVVVDPLLKSSRVDLKKWLKKFNATGGSMMGSKRYSLPLDPEERIALIYQLLLAFSSGKTSAHQFGIDAFGGDGPDEVFEAINSQLVERFVADISEKLDDVESKIGDREQVSSASLTIFNYGTYQNFSGDVQGVVAVNSTVSKIHQTFNNSSELARAVKELGDDLNDVLEDHRESVTGAFAVLIKAIETNTVPKLVEVATAVQAIGEGSPTGLQRLRGIIDNAAGSLLGEALKPLIALVLTTQSG
jgi:hypothetical protein